MQQLIIVKKYSNRRLYDTAESRYITLEELAEKIRAGSDIRVVDAKSDEDLTQSTLTQIILESRGAARLLPIPLLIQLIRMGDDALAEFLGRYMAWSLEMYLQAKQGAQAAMPYNPFQVSPFAGNPFGRGYGQVPNWADVANGGAAAGMPVSMGAPAPAGPPPAAAPSAATPNEVADLRRELDALKKSLRRKSR